LVREILFILVKKTLKICEGVTCFVSGGGREIKVKCNECGVLTNFYWVEILCEPCQISIYSETAKFTYINCKDKRYCGFKLQIQYFKFWFNHTFDLLSFLKLWF